MEAYVDELTIVVGSNRGGVLDGRIREVRIAGATGLTWHSSGRGTTRQKTLCGLGRGIPACSDHPRVLAEKGTAS